MRTSLRRVLVTLCIILSLAFLVTYGFFEARRFLQGPSVFIETPREGARIEGPAILITGVASNISFITLNGRQIYIDEEGRFGETLTPPPGYTVLTVDVRDRFGRVKRAVRTLVIE